MTDANLLIAAILGVVEGVTEFLPVSSTGHLIVAGSLLDYTGEKAKLFEIVIQAGAILAVCWEYRAKLLAVAAGIFRDPGAINRLSTKRCAPGSRKMPAATASSFARYS